jgi:hypothetical protein
VDLSGGERKARGEVQQLEEVRRCFDHPRTVAKASATHQRPAPASVTGDARGHADERRPSSGSRVREREETAVIDVVIWSDIV